MNAGRGLPLNGWVFLLLYWLLLFLTFAAPAEGVLSWLSAAQLVGMTLQVVWILQAGLYAFRVQTTKSPLSPREENRRRFLIVSSVISLIATWCLLPMSIFHGDIEAYPDLQDIVAPVVVILFFTSAFTTIYLTSEALLDAERRPTGMVHTCAMLLYLGLFAPFLYARLKSLSLDTDIGEPRSNLA